MFVSDYPISTFARTQIQRNFPDLVYYLRYDILSPSLIANGVLRDEDIEQLALETWTNSQRMTFILNDVILKGSTRNLRSFLECLEENNYAIYAKKIREAGALGKYQEIQEQQQQARATRNAKASSMPNFSINDNQPLISFQEESDNV